MKRENLCESLSALMDDEADELELRRILRELPANGELSATWQRYHTVRASLQQEIHRNPAVNLLNGINARLAAESESHPAVPFGRVMKSGFLRYLGQGAIAASVAVAALMSVSLLETAQTDGPAASIADAGPVASPVLNGDYNAELTRTVATDAGELTRLEQAVYQEFSGLPPAEEIPVSYNLNFPLQSSSAQ